VDVVEYQMNKAWRRTGCIDEMGEMLELVKTVNSPMAFAVAIH
jgi:hypothetical protein